jgi:CheY-like chemotaxis protein
VRVLVADDEAAILSWWARLLRASFDAEVVLVHDGAAAVERLDEEHFDLVVTDYRMPRLTGIDVIRHAHRRFPSLPALLVTGEPSDQVISDAALVGAAGLLIKPFDLDAARRAVSAALLSRGSLRSVTSNPRGGAP